MKMEVAGRLNGIGEYYFSQKLKEIEALNKQGVPVINLGIGSPDLPPHHEVIKVLQEEAAKPSVHAYQSYKGAAALRNAFSAWYRTWYGVELDPATEILPLIGSKEGIMHICMTYLNEGDSALIPNPGYPTYSSAVKLAGGKCVSYELKENNNWQIDFEELQELVMSRPIPEAPSGSPGGGMTPSQPWPVGGPATSAAMSQSGPSQLGAPSPLEESNAQPSPVGETAKSAVALQSEERSAGGLPTGKVGMGQGAVKLMFVNYPHMPTGRLPTKELFEKLVAFGKKNKILICHDNPYSFILNEHPMSLLSVDGAKDCVIELNSLSKSQNMAGWRVGVLCGAKERIDDVLRFKSNMDSGMFLPVQLAAAKALSLGKDWYDSVNEVYKSRRTKAYELLDLLGCQYAKEQAGMFLWAKVPSRYKTGFELSDEVLYGSRVFITPGGIFGSAGEAFIRVSLCSPEEKFAASLQRIKTALP